MDPSGHFKRRVMNLGCVPTLVRRAPGHVATEEHKEKAAVAGQEKGKNENNEQAKDDKEKPQEVAAVAAAEKVTNEDHERAEEVAAVAPAEEVTNEAVEEDEADYEPDGEGATTDRKEDGEVAAKTDNKTDDNKDGAVAAKTDDKTEDAKEEEDPKLEMDAVARLMDLGKIKQKTTDTRWWIRGVHQVLIWVGTARHGKGASKGWAKRS